MRLLRIAAATFLGTASGLGSDAPADNAAAIALYRDKKNPEARAAFEQLVTADAKNAEAIHFLGLIALRDKRDDDAVRLHETATALAPQNSSYLISLGEAYGRKASSASLFSKLTWAKKCLAALEKAVALEPGSLTTNAALIEYYRRAPAMAGGGMDKAYAHAATFRKRDLLGGTQLLTALYARELKFPEMINALDQALLVHPDDYSLLLSLGRASAASGIQLDRGSGALQRCLTLTPPPRGPGHASAWFYLGQISARRNDPAAAKSAYEEALKRDPNHREAAAALRL